MPANPAGKRGMIFDEAHERSGAVRFNNIAGEEHAQCTSDLEVRVIRTVEEMFDSKTSTKLESSTSQLGPELDVNLNLFIPPIWKSLASSNEREQKIVTAIDSKQVTTTKATTH